MFRFDSETHTYWLGERRLPSPTGLIKEFGLYQYEDTPTQIWYRDRGSAVHKACELFDKRDLDESTLDPEIVPYLEQYKAFLKVSGAQVLRNEEPAYHPTLMYAGTIDRVYLLNGKPVVVDIKTGTPEPWHGIQLVAYKLIAETLEHGATAMKCYGLYLTKESYRLIEYKSREHIAAWMAILTLNAWKEHHK